MPLLRRRSPDPLDVARAMLALPGPIRPRLTIGAIEVPDTAPALVEAIAVRLAGQLREGDMLARIPRGFLVILPGADLWRADGIRRRFIDATEALTELRYGFATAEPDESDVDPVVARAYAALAA